jgi:hypothetical protein
LKFNFLMVGSSFYESNLREPAIVVLFVDWKYAKTLYFPALPLHLDAAWPVHFTMDGTRMVAASRARRSPACLCPWGKMGVSLGPSPLRGPECSGDRTNAMLGNSENANMGLILSASTEKMPMSVEELNGRSTLVAIYKCETLDQLGAFRRQERAAWNRQFPLLSGQPKRAIAQPRIRSSALFTLNYTGWRSGN